MNLNYYYLLNLISELSSNTNKNLIKNNISKLSDDFSNLSKYISKYINISADHNLTRTEKIKEIKNTGYLNTKFTKKQADNIFKTLNFENIKGGSVQEKNLYNLKNEFDGSVNFCLKELPIMVIKLFFTPKYLFLAVSSFFAWLAELFDFGFDFDSEGWLDFSQDIDWIYLFLFITASVPFLGQIPSFIITVKALIDGKYFLAIINTITTIISIIFTLHLVDLGLIFKIFYYFDVMSYKNELNNLESNKNDTLEYKNNLDQTVKFKDINSNSNKSSVNLDTINNTENKILNNNFKEKTKKIINKTSLSPNKIIDNTTKSIDSSVSKNIAKVDKIVDNTTRSINSSVSKNIAKVDKIVDNTTKSIDSSIDKTSLAANKIIDNMKVKKLKHLREKIDKLEKNL